MDNYIVDIKNLTKIYSYSERSLFVRKKEWSKLQKVALENITLSITEGEFVGLVGNNGAGKSTLIKVMTGILHPDSGKVSVLGRNPFKERVKNNFDIGVVFGQRTQLKWDLPAIDSYRLLKRMYLVDDLTFKSNLDYFTALFDIEDVINKPIRTLSLGQRMKCEIVAAFLHNPKIVFLDEPTIGLDIFSKDAVINFFHEIKKTRNTTVILTTHDLEEMGKICDRAILIQNGKILLEGEIDQLLEISNQKKQITLKVKEEKPIICSELQQYSCSVLPHKVTVNLVEKDQIHNVISLALQCNEVIDINISEENFTDLVRSYLMEE